VAELLHQWMDPMSEAADRFDPAAAGQAELLLRARAGERDAFEALMVRHERLVFHTAWRLLGDREEARNAAQEVFLRLHRSLRRVDERRPLEPWLYRLTVNACRDLQRRRPRLPLLPLETLGPADLSAAVAEPGQEAIVAVGEARRLVAEALRQLPPRERAAVVLRDIEGLSAEEAARILGSTAATVRSQACSARLKIRRFAERLRRRS
jgi:RNA polymerase sigma-70 factor (ECF subfamily)